MFIVGHTLVWHNQTPAWVFEDDAGQAARPRGAARADAGPHPHRGRPLQGADQRLGRGQRSASMPRRHDAAETQVARDHRRRLHRPRPFDLPTRPTPTPSCTTTTTTNGSRQMRGRSSKLVRDLEGQGRSRSTASACRGIGASIIRRSTRPRRARGVCRRGRQGDDHRARHRDVLPDARQYRGHRHFRRQGADEEARPVSGRPARRHAARSWPTATATSSRCSTSIATRSTA